MSTTDANSIERRYKKRSLWLYVAITLIGLLAVQILHLPQLIRPIAVSASYSILIARIYARAWRYMAEHSPAVLPRFYMMAPMIKMFITLLGIVIGAVVYRGNKPMILIFVGIFTGYYVATRIYDSIYFYQVEKNNKKTNNKI